MHEQLPRLVNSRNARLVGAIMQNSKSATRKIDTATTVSSRSLIEALVLRVCDAEYLHVSPTQRNQASTTKVVSPMSRGRRPGMSDCVNPVKAAVGKQGAGGTQPGRR